MNWSADEQDVWQSKASETEADEFKAWQQRFRQRLPLYVIAFAMFVVTLSVSLSASATDVGQNWVFVVFYVMIFLYAMVNQLWFSALAAFLVSVVRALVTLKVTGFPLQLSSSAFVGAFFLAMIVNIERKETDNLHGRKGG